MYIYFESYFLGSKVQINTSTTHISIKKSYIFDKFYNKNYVKTISNTSF